jgi:isopentenyl diphosphate isomerase/L-lactate dehydrogenase-like FMN-dependent dehydrogenase
MTALPNASPFLTLHELVKKARQKLNQDDWDYIVGATETETTLRRNRLALDSLAFRPRVLRDVSRIDSSLSFLGRKLRLPLLMAPVGSLELFSPDAAVSSARACEQFGIAHMLSSVCEPGMTALAKAVPDALRIFQLYVYGDAAWIDETMAEAIETGNQAFCFTVDMALYSRRERDIAKRNIRRAVVPGREFLAQFSWKDIERIRAKHSIPLILKGIATAEDALMAVEHGIDMVYVSNHGGRQLDHGLGSMEVLPEIVAAVAGRAKVIVDGGFNRGSDIVKAIALGADIVGLGRMQCLGLAADGADGLLRMLELLELEVRICLGLLGVTRLDELNGAHLRAVQPTGPVGALSAFPLLSLDEGALY